MGCCPKGVDPDLAMEFTKTFVPRLNIKKFKDLKVRMKEIMAAGKV